MDYIFETLDTRQGRHKEKLVRDIDKIETTHRRFILITKKGKKIKLRTDTWHAPRQVKSGQGWHESPDATGKAPEHVLVATKTATKDILRIPMVTEKLFLSDPIIPPCKSCGSCCLAYPCGIEPKEIYPIARYLGISVRELFDTYLTADYYDYDMGMEELLYVAPRRAGDRPGRFDRVDSHWDFPYPPRACIFLIGEDGTRGVPHIKNDKAGTWVVGTGKNLCQIHPVKPKTAKDTFCKLKKIEYKKRLGNLWKPYFKPQGDGDDDWLDYADRVNYEKLERDFGGK